MSETQLKTFTKKDRSGENAHYHTFFDLKVQSNQFVLISLCIKFYNNLLGLLPFLRLSVVLFLSRFPRVFERLWFISFDVKISSF